MSTGVWARFRRRRLHRGALGLLLGFGVLALGADLLASDLPLALRLDGELRVLPALTGPGRLRSEDLDSLRQRLRADQGDWMVAPPVPFGPYRTDLSLPSLPSPPSARHLLGTDETGRDVLSRLIHGARASLGVGLVAVLLSLLIGVGLGAAAGYLGGALDAVVSRGTEVVLTFPTLFLVLALMAVVERPAAWHVALVIGVTRWPDVARLTRAEVLRVKQLPFVEAARALGLGEGRVLVRHVLPNALGPVLVTAAFGVSGAILLESALSFLGFGVPPPAASWGETLMQAHRYVTSPGAWWLAVFPGAAVFLTVTACNLVAEGLQEALVAKTDT